MGLGVVKEWNCLEHGPFESSHAICPAHGCRSRAVTQEFRTAPRVGTRMVKQFDAGIRRTVDMMRLNDLRTARAGETAFGGDKGGPTGTRVLWGDQDVRRTLGRSVGELMGLAAKPLNVRSHTNPEQVLPSPRNNGVAGAATEGGITQSRFLGKPLPSPADNAAYRGDKKSMRALGQNVS
jgi:hypothetical protein